MSQTMEERIAQLPNVADYNPPMVSELLRESGREHMRRVGKANKSNLKNLETRTKMSLGQKASWARMSIIAREKRKIGLKLGNAALYANMTAEGKNQQTVAMRAYFDNMTDDDRIRHGRCISFAKLEGEVPFSKKEALNMGELEYAVKSLAFRKHKYFSLGMNRVIIGALYPKFECICGLPAEHTHHITGNPEHHGKGRVLWVVPLCISHHRKVGHDLRAGRTEWAYKLYQFALEHQLPEGLEIVIPATQGLSFEELLKL